MDSETPVEIKDDGTVTAAPAPTPPPIPPLVPPEPIPPAPAAQVNGEQAMTGEPIKKPSTITYKTKDWYRENLDWHKSNRELAKTAGVTHQRIGQLRKELFPDGNVPPAPITPEPAVLPDERPNFTDLEEPAAPLPQAPPKPPVDYQGLSEMTFDLSTGMLSKILGPEWQPQNQEERGVVVKAIKAYAESKQLPDIPPGLMLVIIVGIYAAPRLQSPPTKNKLALAWAWVKVKIFKRKAKIPPVIKIHESQ